MSASPPPDRFDDLPILDELRERLGAAYRSAHARPRHARRPRAHRWRASVVVGVVVLGGAAGALAAAGAFRAGSPYGNNYPHTPHAYSGVVSHDSVQLLRTAVPDPQGGPPWGLRINRTTRGLICVADGRLDHGTIGALGIDGAFGDDGRFHPLSLESVGGQAQVGCAAADAHGHGFVSVTAEAVPASGLLGGCHGVAASLFANVPNKRAARLLRSFAEREGGPICPPADLRNVYYGLLGPDAVSVTYPGPDGRPVTERTVGPDGAYLVLGPPTGASCQPLGGCESAGAGSGAGLAPGFITSVAYRNGYVCPIAALEEPAVRAAARYQHELAARFPAVARALATPGTLSAAQRAAAVAETPAYRAFQRANGPLLRRYQNPPTCPLLGYVSLPSVDVTAADVATPVTATVEGPGACLRFDGRRICNPDEIGVTVDFRARVAVTNTTSHYEVNMRFTPTGSCSSNGGGGQSAPTESNLRAGQLVRMPTFVADCPTRISGDVVYDAARNRAFHPETLPGMPAPIGGVLVGTFHLKVP